MLYRIVGREVATHRHVDIPNWEAPNIATAKRLATEIGIVVSRIEPMNGPPHGKQEEGNEHDRNAPASDSDDSLMRGIPLKALAAKAPETEAAGAEAVSLINCPTCGKPISEVAKSCPGCGLPLTLDVVAAQKAKKQKAEQASAMTVFGGLGVFLVFFLLCSGVFKSQPSSPPSPVVETTVANKVAAVYYQDRYGAPISESVAEASLEKIRNKVRSMPDNLERAYWEGVLESMEREWATAKSPRAGRTSPGCQYQDRRAGLDW